MRCTAVTRSMTWLPVAAALWVLVSLLFFHGEAQGGSRRTTDPVEVRALNAIFQKWNISSSMSVSPWTWNTTNDLCSGAAITEAGQKAYDTPPITMFNPSIVCDCSYNNGSTCHITRLKAYDLGIAGTIPEELSYLTHLNNLQIAKNYLFGPLPAFFGNFSKMEWLSIGINALSGPIPKELGNLVILKSLGMGMNNFSGPLPPELGNLTSLQEIYIDSIGVSGEIPSTFGNLQNVHTMWAPDNNFGGMVPEFLGNLTNMKSMYIEFYNNCVQ